MTKNQLEFQKNYETRRHNLELEREQEYANLSGRLTAHAAGLNAQASMQNAAANAKQAEISASAQAETERHNLRSEGISEATAITQGVKNISDALSRIATVAATFG